jgi:PKD repeat protein
MVMVIAAGLSWGCAEKKAPVASFISDVTSGIYPLQVQFTDQSTGSIDSWFWHFGDGGTSADRSPSHTYDKAGTYTVSLVVARGGNADTEVKKDYITVAELPLQADFIAGPTSGCYPLEVQFVDQSTGHIDSWSWDFGDGGTGLGPSPSHTYGNTGNYTVTLTVTQGEQSSNEIKIDYITVYEHPLADFSASPTRVGAGLAVQFTDKSKAATSWQWDFDNDGTVDSTEQNPSYVYGTPGNYTVSLKVGGPGGTDTVTKVDYITVTPTDFSIALPAGWVQDSARQEERDIFFQSVKEMGIIVGGIPLESDQWCSGFFVSPTGDAYVELHGSASPYAGVTASLAFPYVPQPLYHKGYQQVSDPVYDQANLNATYVFTCDDGKGKERLAVRQAPPEVWFVTCVATTEAAFDAYESTFDEILDSFTFKAAPPGPDPSEEFTQYGPPFRIVKEPYLLNVTKTGITIMWETSQESNSKVDYGKEKIGELAPTYTDEIVSDKLTRIHEITLTGLEEETFYNYRVISQMPSEGDPQEAASKNYIFKTAPGEGTPFTFAVYGDNRTPIVGEKSQTVHEEIASAIAGRRPDFVLNTGDVVTYGKKYEEWNTELFASASEILKDTPYYIAIGNHEEDAHWFYDFFPYPAPGDYYSFDYGNAHFTILDTNQDYSPGSAQYNWLEADLASSNATWNIVACHHPFYSSNDVLQTELRDTISPILEKYHVDLVFNGHEHLYERSYPIKNGAIDFEQGIIYVTTGGGAAELKQFQTVKKPWYIAEGKVVHHYCLVKVCGGNFEMQVYDVDGNLIDLLTLTKPLITHSLTMAVNDPAGGTTTPGVGGHSYAEGRVVTISASPAAGWRFDDWTGNVANPDSITTTVTMDADQVVTANFSALAQYTLTMAVDDPSHGETTPGVGANTVYEGLVAIIAIPAAGWQFDHWSGDVGTVANVNSANTTITMDADYAINANFVVASILIYPGVGSHWVYNVHYAALTPEDTVWTMNVTAVEAKSGVDCYTTVTAYSAGPVRSTGGTQVTVTGSTVCRSQTTLDPVHTDASILLFGMTVATAMEATYATADHGWPLYVGKQWQYSEATTLTPPLASPYTRTIVAEVVAQEDVTVPAGTFSCYKITYTLTATTQSPPGTLPRLLKTEWWSPDVRGLVKVENYTYDALETQELVSYTVA